MGYIITLREIMLNRGYDKVAELRTDIENLQVQAN